MPKQLRCNVVLNQAVNELWNSAIANTTRTVYDTGFRKFETFMLLNGFQFTSLPPISEDILIYFIAHCFKILSLQYSTIKLYLCGIRYKYVQGNQNDPLQSANNTPLIRLDYVLNSVKRLQKTKKSLKITNNFRNFGENCKLFEERFLLQVYSFDVKNCMHCRILWIFEMWRVYSVKGRTI